MKESNAWNDIADPKRIEALFQILIDQSQDGSLSLNDKRLLMIYPEKTISMTPIKLFQHRIIAYSDQDIGRDELLFQFFVSSKRWIVRGRIRFHQSNNRYYADLPKQIRVRTAHPVYRLHRLLARQMNLELLGDPERSIPGQPIDLSLQGIGVFSRSPVLIPGLTLDALKLTVFPGLALVFRQPTIRDKKGYYHLVIFDFDQVELQLDEGVGPKNPWIDRTARYRDDFNYPRFLENFLVPEIRRFEQELIKKEKEEQQKKQARTEFYFGSDWIDQNETDCLFSQLIVFEIPAMRMLWTRFQSIPGISTYDGLEIEKDEAILDRVPLICAEYRLVCSQSEFFQDRHYKTVIIYHTCDSALAPSFTERNVYLGCFSYAQLGILPDDQLLKALGCLLIQDHRN